MTILIPILLTVINIVYFIYIGIDEVPYLLFAGINMLITFSVMFAHEKKAFTLLKMVNLFCYVFFVLANGVQFASFNNVLTFRLYFEQYDFIWFQALVSLILILFNTIYKYLYSRNITKIKHKRQPRQNIKVNGKLLVILGVFGCIATWMYYHFDFRALLFRGFSTSFLADENLGTTSNLLFQNFIRPIPFAVFVVSILGKVDRKIQILLFVLTLLTVFPTALARNAAAMYWIPVVILLFSKYLRHNLFMWFMMVAIFVLFPFLNLFRGVMKGNFSFSWSMEFFNDINFDASQIFMATIKTDFVTYGRQILGPLFFYVPRSLWPDKPVGSGHELVHLHNGWWANVSMPFFSEGYVNFGWIGILIFVLILAYFCAKMDADYWTKWVHTNDLKIGYYLICLGAVIFIMRGDLLSSFSYTVGIMVSYSFILLLCSNFHFTKLRFK